MKATLVLHCPPADLSDGSDATERVKEIAESVRELLGANQVIVRGGSGWNWEITFS